MKGVKVAGCKLNVEGGRLSGEPPISRSWISVLVVVFLLLSAVIAGGFALQQSRDGVRYPGAVAVAASRSYQDLPHHIAWDDTYVVNASFPEVYEWYRAQFALEPNRLTTGGCVSLRGASSWFVVVQQMNVVVCNSARGQTIQVSRTMLFWR